MPGKMRDTAVTVEIGYSIYLPIKTTPTLMENDFNEYLDSLRNPKAKQNEIEKKKIEAERIKTHKEVSNTYNVKKRNDKYKIKEEISSELTEQISSFLNKKDNGNYALQITTISEFNKVVDNKIVVLKYDKSFLDKATDHTPIGLFK
jgi:hypothetical protein